MGLMQKIFGAADPATGRRTQADPRMKGAGRGAQPRSMRGKVPPGRSRPSVGFGRRSRKPPPQSGFQRLISSVTRKR
jgi:hypothetical protein